ncbi:hypothetical protein ACFFX1_55600 [Dactylosporangium sucinum]|uniref:Uncharacterized protein n=1 Tax=Dactylosporangium sucinum TaxID=1424081 RepID=A0A917X1X6_9ACTN|nr:hypothetical protein [Dactylosporangium sucinum]GGM52376.1 hypothetical protein GCM10007977_062440 [Dactylosporangium sucinum]
MTEQPPPMYLNEFGTPAPNRNRRTTLIVSAGAVVALLLVGGAVAVGLALRVDNKPTGQAEAATSSSPTPSAQSSPSPSPSPLPGDVIAQETCVEVNEAYARADDLYRPDVVKALGEKARKSSVPEVQDFGTRMATKAEIAAKNKGKDAELSTTLEMSTVATQFATWCLKNGYIRPKK